MPRQLTPHRVGPPQPRPAHRPLPPPRSGEKPASDVLAGALARAASQSTIHPIDTIKVRMQSGSSAGSSKVPQLVTPPLAGAGVRDALGRALPRVASLYSGVVGAASGAGIAIGAYFACYGAAHNALSRAFSSAPAWAVAFVAGAAAAAGSSFVKVPIAVCIRSVQAGRYPSAGHAASSILRAVGPRGLFTGFVPTLLEDIPDMAFKFAAYESLVRPGGEMCGGTHSMHKHAWHGLARAHRMPLSRLHSVSCTGGSRGARRRHRRTSRWAPWRVPLPPRPPPHWTWSRPT